MAESPGSCFDLSADPHETRNLIDEPAYARMISQLKDSLRQIGRRAPTIPSNQTSDGANNALSAFVRSPSLILGEGFGVGAEAEENNDDRPHPRQWRKALGQHYGDGEDRRYPRRRQPSPHPQR